MRNSWNLKSHVIALARRADGLPHAAFAVAFLVVASFGAAAAAESAPSANAKMPTLRIAYASLYFSAALVGEKVAVAITSALSGAVLLNTINNQLNSIGYTMAVEYVFYVFFGLSLLCILSVLGAERLRAVGRGETAIRTERWTRTVFLLTVAGTLADTMRLYWSH